MPYSISHGGDFFKRGLATGEEVGYSYLMPKRVKIGCCGFPVARKKYYEGMGVVELQRTFYEPPGDALLRKWRAEAPRGFEFTLKAWQLITHSPESPTYGKLKTEIHASKRKHYGSFKPTVEVLWAWERTREAAKLLGARVVVFQSPPGFVPSAGNRRNMEGFFTSIERRGLLLGWEPRGRWEPGEVKALCADLGLIHVVDPFRARPVSGGTRYFRLHGKGGYGYKYTEKDIGALAGLASENPGAYFMFNNVHMFDDALALKRALGEG